MSCDWRELKFGVEIELTFISRLETAQIVSDFFETYYSYSDDSFYEYEVKDNLKRIWRITRDGSIKAESRHELEGVSIDDDYQVEIVTPILQYDNDILILQQLLENLRKGGAEVNNSCGVHIHVDAQLFDPKHLRVLCNLLYSKQNIIERALVVKDSRKKYCKLLDKNFIETLNKIKPSTIDKLANIWYGFDIEKPGYGSFRSNKYHQTRYFALNLHNIFSERMKTIEYRIFNSTTIGGVLKAYIQFSLVLTAKALNQNRASHRERFTFNDKWTMRTWLVRLGMVGDEFKIKRQHLTKQLIGSPSWKDKIIDEITF